MEKRELTGYLLIFALVVVVALIFVSAFKAEDKSEEQVTVEQPRKVNPQNNEPRDTFEKNKAQEMPWAGIM